MKTFTETVAVFNSYSDSNDYVPVTYTEEEYKQIAASGLFWCRKNTFKEARERLVKLGLDHECFDNFWRKKKMTRLIDLAARKLVDEKEAHWFMGFV